MRKIILISIVLILLIFTTQQVFAVTLIDISDTVINPEKSTKKFLFAIKTSNEDEFSYHIGDFVRGRTITDSAGLRTMTYNDCNLLDGRVVNAVYENNLLVSLTCFFPIEKEIEETIIKNEQESKYSDYKGIGEKCSSVNECGSACDNFGSDYSPRCIDGGYGRVCFCGTNEGVYTTVCARDSDCPVNEICGDRSKYSGVCTTKNTPSTGNPVELDEKSITEIFEENIRIEHKKCSDGTLMFACSKDRPYYCNSNSELVPYSGICGCPDGQMLDPFNLRNCCDEDGFNCLGLTCEPGEVIEQDCGNGNKIVIKKCFSNGWKNVAGVCPMDNNNLDLTKIIIFISLGLALLFVLGGSGLLIFGKK